MSISIRPLTPVFGAEITDIDLSEPLDHPSVIEVKDAFEEYSVLLFPNQNISDEDHIAFTNHFGPAETPRQHFAAYHHKPNINAVIKHKEIRHDKGETARDQQHKTSCRQGDSWSHPSPK